MIDKVTYKGLKIVIVHGFNVKDGGKGSIDRLAPWLRQKYPRANIDTDSADYGWHGLLKVRFFWRTAVKRIAATLHDADIVITHSNGANYTMKAIRKHVRNEKLHVVHISPALNRKQRLERLVFRKMDTFHSDGDFWVKVGGWLPFHPWGPAGASGIISDDPRHNNWPLKDPSHSGWFGELSIRCFCEEKLFPVIDKNLEVPK